MLNSKTDLDWEKFGESDPYFGVVSVDKFHKTGLTDEGKEPFFRHGHEYVADILSKISPFLSIECEK